MGKILALLRQVKKKALNLIDDKRFVCDNQINTHARGHYLTLKN